MAKTSDPLIGEVSVEGALTDSDITVKAKSRFIAAVDRLLGNVFDAANPAMERRTSRARAIVQAEREIIEASGKAVVAQIQTRPEFADRAIDNHLRQIARMQSNKDAVVDIATKELKRLPSPDLEIPDSPNTIDDDWLNLFESLAEKATSDRMRDLFGRILAGEVRRPGAFSLKTLRVASELDQSTARDFQTITEGRILDGIFRQPSEFIRQITHSDFLDLETAGLVSFEGANLTFNFRKNDEERCLVKGESLCAVLIFKPEQTEFQQPVVRLTKAGLELARILPYDETSAFQQMVPKIAQYIESAKLHTLFSVKDGRIHFSTEPIAILFPVD